MVAETTHEQELQDLFNKLPVVTQNGEPSQVNGEPIKMITYPILMSIVDNMMNKAYYYGKIAAVDDVKDLMISTFK